MCFLKVIKDCAGFSEYRQTLVSVDSVFLLGFYFDEQGPTESIHSLQNTHTQKITRALLALFLFVGVPLELIPN